MSLPKILLCGFLLATFTVSASIDDEEAFISLRSYYATVALEHFMDKEYRIPPYVDLCCSGGSVRAALACLGVIEGLKQIGLYDAIRIEAATSGGTWFSAAQYYYKCPIMELRAIFKQNLHHNVLDDFVDTFQGLCDEERVNNVDNASKLQLCDIWGALLTRHFFGTNFEEPLVRQLGDLLPTQDVQSFSQFAHDYPLPIFTVAEPALVDCCFPLQGLATPCTWYDLTPYTAYKHPDANNWADSIIPIESVGPLGLGRLMGICGSAYCGGPNDVVRRIFPTTPPTAVNRNLTGIEYKTIFEKVIERELEKTRAYRFFAPALLPFNDNVIAIRDAGFSTNDPLLPLLRYGSDIIIMCEASAGTENGEYVELQKAIDYCRGLPEPYAKLTQLKEPIRRGDNLLVFSSDNPKVPTLIYFYNKNKYPSNQFNYTTTKVDKLCNDMMKAVIDSADVIKEEISKKAVPLIYAQ